MEARCLMCVNWFDLPESEDDFVTGKYSGESYGICPTCQGYAEAGKRASELSYINRGSEDACYAEGWNDCLSHIKVKTK
jgi:hypothetical protein